MHTVFRILTAAALSCALPHAAHPETILNRPQISADLRFREKAWDIHTLDESNPFHDRRFERLRLRLSTTWAPSESLALLGRMLWESRHYRRPSRFEEWYSGQAFPDIFPLR